MRALLLLVVGGCAASPHDRPAIDGGADLAAGPDLASSCAQHALLPVVLDAIEPIDPVARASALLRVRVRYGRGRCDPPGPIAVTSLNGGAGDELRIVASVWRGGDCVERVVETRAIDLAVAGKLAGPKIVVRDGASGGSAQLTLDLLPAPVASCAPAVLGASCQLDCQCQASAPLSRCAPRTGGDGRCAIACSEDSDCPADTPRCSAPVAPASCGGGACASDLECPFGQRCIPVGGGGPACRPVEPTAMGGCACDADCGAGQICARGVCLSPCVTDFDCRSGNCNGQNGCDGLGG